MPAVEFDALSRYLSGLEADEVKITPWASDFLRNKRIEIALGLRFSRSFAASQFDYDVDSVRSKYQVGIGDNC